MTKSPKAALRPRPRHADTTAQPPSSPSSPTSTETENLPHPHPSEAANQAASKGPFILPTPSDDPSGGLLRLAGSPDELMDQLERLALQQIGTLRALQVTAQFVAMFDAPDDPSAARRSCIPTVNDAEETILVPILRSLNEKLAAQVRALGSGTEEPADLSATNARP